MRLMNNATSRSARAVLFALALCLTVTQLFPSELPVAEPDVPAFGYDMFRQLPEPITDGPTDDEYLLSPGDEIIITVWGELNLKYPLTVSEDGYVDIPDEGGRIFTNGASIKEFRRLVVEALSKIYAAYIEPSNPAASKAFVDVKLAKTRRLLVYVVGEVAKPGVYTISSSAATLLNLLNNAGGIKESGSLRRVTVRRADGSLENVDLYDLLLTGKIETSAIRLRYGDYIIVPLKTKSSSIRGAVRRPGLYELVGNNGLQELIGFAGGLTSNAYLKRVQVRRNEVNIGETVLDTNLEQIMQDGSAFAMVDGDRVEVFTSSPLREPVVRISGPGVKRPGTYAFAAGMRINDLIGGAEGLREEALLDRADLIRTQDDFSKKLLRFSLKKTATGGLTAVSGEASLAHADFELRELDEVIVYSQFELKGKDKTVTLAGHAKNPGDYLFAEGTTLRDLLFAHAGLEDPVYRQNTFLERAHIFRQRENLAGEEIFAFNVLRTLQDPSADLPLKAGDRVVLYEQSGAPVKDYVDLEGAVREPGRFDYSAGLTVADLVLKAGGLPTQAARARVEAVVARRVRSSEGEPVTFEEELVELTIEDQGRTVTSTYELQPYDRVAVRFVAGWEAQPVASVTGMVVKPGSIVMSPGGDRLADVLSKAGGLRPEALPEGAVLMRYTELIRFNPKEGNEERLKVNIDLKKALEHPGGPEDILLADGDQVFVPQNPGAVIVTGAVVSPGLLRYQKGANVADYVKLCGGFKADADKGETILRLPNGTAVRARRFLHWLDVPPGTVIQVPTMPPPAPEASAADGESKPSPNRSPEGAGS